jgi:transposase InsO family protein
LALPDSMETLKCILYQIEPSDMTTERISTRILEDQKRRIRASGESVTAFFAKSAAKKGRGKGKDKDKDKEKEKSDDKDKKRCTHCRYIGHEKSECRKLKKEQEEKAKAASSSTANVAVAPNANASTATANLAQADIPLSGVTCLYLASTDLNPTPCNTRGGSTEHILKTQAELKESNVSNKWIMDSGASRTMCSRREWFTHYVPLQSPINVVLGDESSIPAPGVGRITVRMRAENKWTHSIFQDVLYVPNLHGNLLSVPHLADCGAEVSFKGKHCSVLNEQGELICEGHRHGTLYVMDIQVPRPETARIAGVEDFPSEGDNALIYALAARSNVSKASLDVWHRRFGHLHIDAVLRMLQKGMVKGMEISDKSPRTHPCEPCLKGKQTQAEISKITEDRSDVILGRIHSDLCGKQPTRTHHGFEYFVTFTDDKSRKVGIAGLRKKSEALHQLKVFIAHAELQTGHKVKIVRSDGGGEYDSREVTRFLQDKGISQELTTPATPQHNGVSERMNRTLLERVRSMLDDADLPDSFWLEAALYAAHIHNVTPTRALDDMTPEECWSGTKPDVSRLRVFGARAFVHVPKKHRTKLSARSLICQFVGFAPNRRAYRLYHRTSRRFLESRDVVFDEGGPAPLFERVILEPNHADGTETDEEEGDIEIVPTEPEPTTSTSLAANRPKRTIQPPIRDDDPRYSVTSYGPRKPKIAQANLADGEPLTDPRSYAEAMARPDANEWEAACMAEMSVFDHMGVYEIVPRPKDRKVVGSKWVFRIKRGPDGAIQKYKARIVAQGFTQIEGIDFDETFAPVAKLASLQTILALAAEQDLEVHQMDVKSAYLNGNLSEQIYMEPPPGLEVPEGSVLHLKKAVYGTKQGGRVWYEDIRDTLKTMGYQRTEADHAIFSRNNNNTLSIIALYVDDITMVSKDLGVINQDKNMLKRRYEMTDLGEMSWILGVHITRNRLEGWIALSQEKYINEILDRFEKSDVRPISTPTLPNEHLVKLPSPEVNAKLYQRMVGALMYTMLGTRPDLAYTVATLGRHAANPGDDHQQALDRAFRYLRTTKNSCLVFQRGTPDSSTLTGYVDADWASDVNDRKSTSGFAFMLSGAAISWSSKKQPSVALSSTEAEYIAAAHAAKECIWLRRLLMELGLPPHSATPLHMDNQSAIAIARNPEFHDRTKHIEVRHHFLRQKVEGEEITLVYTPTGDQTADILTKGLSREKHEKFSRKMGLRRLG